MKRHGDSQRLVSSESLTVRRAHASMPRLRSDGTVMTRYDDSQRSGRLAVTFGDLRVVDRVVASIASLPRLRQLTSLVAGFSSTTGLSDFPTPFIVAVVLGLPDTPRGAIRTYPCQRFTPALASDGA